MQGLAQLRSGRGDLLLALRDAYVGRAADGSHHNLMEADLAINCIDEERRSPAEETAMKRAMYDAAPFMDPGRELVEARDACEHWPAQPTLGFPYADGIEGLPATLTVAVSEDPATPYQGGISLARSLGGSLLTVDVAKHGAVLTGNACVDGRTAEYLTTGRTPPEGTRCPG